MSGVNMAVVMGNLGRDPEVRYTTGGDPVCNFSLATSEKWKDKSGEKVEKTEWHNVVAFGRTAEIAGEFLKKGQQAHVVGRLQTRKWTDKEGNERYTTEIVCDRLTLVGGRQENSEPAPARTAKPAARKANEGDVDDDIPF